MRIAPAISPCRQLLAKVERPFPFSAVSSQFPSEILWGTEQFISEGKFMRWFFILTLALVVSLIAFGVTVVNAQSDFNRTTVHDILKHPDRFVNQTVVVEDEVDHILNDHSFTLEDDDTWFMGGEMAVISVVPYSQLIMGIANNASKTQFQDQDIIMMDGESHNNLEGAAGLQKGKLARVRGVVRQFDQAQLQSEFGEMPFLSSINVKAGEPVLVIGMEKLTREKPAVIEEERVEVEKVPETPSAVEPEPAPTPEPAPAVEPTPEPQPESQPEPATQPEPETLPHTASPLSLIGLIGLFVTGAGIGSRRFRR
jgi:hypothetical protein